MELDSELLFADSINSGIIIIDKDLTIHYWNKWLEARTHILKEEIVEENILDYFHFIDEEQLRRKVKFVSNFKSQSFYTVNPHKFLIDIKMNNITNKVFDLMQQNVSLSPFDYKDKNYIIIQINDVTELESSNLKLNIEKTENRMLLDSQANLIFVFKGGNLDLVNKTTLDFFGFDDIESFKDEHLQIISSIAQKEESDTQQTKIEENPLIELNNKHNEGCIFKANRTSTTTSEETICIVTLTDVTEIEENKQKLIANSKNAAMGEMIAMIAHQWRQPLTTITATIGTLEMQRQLDLLTDDSWELKIDTIKSTLKYMSKTINDFKDFFDNKDVLQEVSVNDLLERPYGLIEASFKSSDSICTFSYELDKDTKILTYPSKFDQVILNIYKNSLDEYISKGIGGQSSLEVKATKNNLIIKYYDNAGGIPEDIIQKIWDPYFSTKSLNGTGIGLHMTKTIVEKQLNGDIKIENFDNSKLNAKGIVCTISLPLDFKKTKLHENS